MKTIKVSEATNAQLDWLVAKCAGHDVGFDAYGVMIQRQQVTDRFNPTTNAGWMYPIIEQVGGLLMKRWLESSREGQCQVEIHNYDGDWIAFGPTLLIAAARCYVMSKLGETVEVPEGL